MSSPKICLACAWTSSIGSGSSGASGRRSARWAKTQKRVPVLGLDRGPSEDRKLNVLVSGEGCRRGRRAVWPVLRRFAGAALLRLLLRRCFFASLRRLPSAVERFSAASVVAPFPLRAAAPPPLLSSLPLSSALLLLLALLLLALLFGKPLRLFLLLAPLLFRRARSARRRASCSRCSFSLPFLVVTRLLFRFLARLFLGQRLFSGGALCLLLRDEVPRDVRSPRRSSLDRFELVLKFLKRLGDELVPGAEFAQRRQGILMRPCLESAARVGYRLLCATLQFPLPPPLVERRKRFRFDALRVQVSRFRCESIVGMADCCFEVALFEAGPRAIGRGLDSTCPFAFPLALAPQLEHLVPNRQRLLRIAIDGQRLIDQVRRFADISPGQCPPRIFEPRVDFLLIERLFSRDP